MKPTAEQLREQLQSAGISMSEAWSLRKSAFLAEGINQRRARAIAAGRYDLPENIYLVVKDLCELMADLPDSEYTEMLSSKCYGGFLK